MYKKFDQQIYIENNDMHQTSHTHVDSIPCFPDIAPLFGSRWDLFGAHNAPASSAPPDLGTSGRGAR